MNCPRCQQGDVRLYRLQSTGELFQVCDECEASWAPPAIPTERQFLQLFEIFDRRGLPESWAELRPADDH
jgi:hypothetical protein